jgi:hypothetical protein
MRTIVFKDLKIPQTQYDELLKEYTTFLVKNAKVKPVFTTIDHDFTDYPTNVDVDGDDVPRPTFLKDISKQVEAKYGKYGTDHIVTLIHEGNWKSGKTDKRAGISGTNYSYTQGPYHIQYCRWWARKGKTKAQELINTFGTLNHEQDHSYDALIQVEIGVDIRPILGVSNYDKQTTHGESPAYHSYIKYQENAAKLKVMAPYLQAAYAKRLERHTADVIGMKKTIIELLQELVYLLNKNKNKKK